MYIYRAIPTSIFIILSRGVHHKRLPILRERLYQLHKAEAPFSELFELNTSAWSVSKILLTFLRGTPLDAFIAATTAVTKVYSFTGTPQPAFQVGTMCHHCAFGIQLLEAVLGFPLKRLPRWGTLTRRVLTPDEWVTAWRQLLLKPVFHQGSTPVDLHIFHSGFIEPFKTFPRQGFQWMLCLFYKGLSTKHSWKTTKLGKTVLCLKENVLYFVKVLLVFLHRLESMDGAPKLVRIIWIALICVNR